ncbi:MAG: hypothetical protein ACLTKI_05540 [Lachnospiraceae bacterium]
MAAMEFDFTEEHYRKERERSDHPLRQAEPMGRQESEREEEKEERLRNPLSGYESSEAERKEKKVPKEQLLLKGRNQRFSSGYDKDGKLTIVFSRDKNDGEVKDQETIKRERSSSMKEDRKYLKAGIHNPKKSAVLLEDREQKRKQFLMGRAAKAIDKPGEMLIEEAFPF